MMPSVRLDPVDLRYCLAVLPLHPHLPARIHPLIEQRPYDENQGDEDRKDEEPDDPAEKRVVMKQTTQP